MDVCLLLDFYGQLLTSKTRNLLELHYEEDMSFSEIGELENISRQAVHDSVKRGVKSLSSYESKLGLARRFLHQKEQIESALSALEENENKRAEALLRQLQEQF